MRDPTSRSLPARSEKPASAVFRGLRDRPAWRGSTACRRWWLRSAPSPCLPIQFCGWSPRPDLWPEEMADKHADDDGERVCHPWEAPHPRSHSVVDRVAACPQCKRLLEHQEKRDQRGRGRDEGKDRFRGEGHFRPSGDVRPYAGPHRKWPIMMPITTAATSPMPGYECTAGRMKSVIGAWLVSSAQLSYASSNVIRPKSAVTVHEKRLPVTSESLPLSCACRTRRRPCRARGDLQRRSLSSH